MSDILTRLLLNTSDYDRNLKKAKNSTNNFAGNLSGKLTSAAGKFAAGIGIAMGGVEAFNKVINSSQTTGDAWNNTISACKDTVNVFFQSLSTGSWAAFNNGLLETLRNMRELASLKDMLSDAKLTMDFDTKQFEREYVRLESIINDETKTKTEREAAFSDMEALIARFKDRVEKTAEGAAKTLITEMNAKFGQNFTLSDLETYITEVNNEFLNTETLQRLNEYKEKLKLFKNGDYVIGGVVMSKKQFIEQNAFLEKMRILQDDNDASRKQMIADLQYLNDLYRRADEYLKRSLEKQIKISNLNKKGVVAKREDPLKTLQISASVSQNIQNNTELGQKVMQSIRTGQPLPIITQPIEIDEVVEEEPLPGLSKKIDDIGKINEELAVFGSIMSMVNGTTAAGSEGWLQWMNNVVHATSAAIVAIRQVVAAKTEEGVVAAGASAAASGPWGWLMIAPAIMSAIAAFGSIPKFAQGGIIGGSSFTGDKLLARVNSGEMILNQNQQGKLLAMTSGQNVRVSGDVRLNGKDIYISLRNYMSASGNKL